MRGNFPESLAVNRIIHAEPDLCFVGRKLGGIESARDRNHLASFGAVTLGQIQVASVAINQHLSVGRPRGIRTKWIQCDGLCQAMGRTTDCGQTPEVPWLVDGEKLGPIGRDAERIEAFGGRGDGERIATRDGYLRHPHGGLGSEAEVKA